MVLGKLPVARCPTIWMTVGQGPIVRAVGAGGGCLDIFTLVYPFSPLSPSLWETARYRLKYCLKGPLSPKQPTNQSKCIKTCFILEFYQICRYIIDTSNFFLSKYTLDRCLYSLNINLSSEETLPGHTGNIFY